MAVSIAMFNHKGGVSKTTTTFNLGWRLADQGKRVLLVDADPQANLTGLVLGLQGYDEENVATGLSEYGNIRDGVRPAFESQPRAIEPVKCAPVSGRGDLHLLPGHIGLAEYEVTLGIAQELSSSIQTLKNLPGAFYELFVLTAASIEADYIIVDMNPGLGAINQNLLMTSDFFIVPMAPDYFSLMAVDSLTVVLPKWKDWSNVARKNQILQGATYPFPDLQTQFLGTIIQKYRLRLGAPTMGFRGWIDQLNERVHSSLAPALKDKGMLSSAETYAKVRTNFEEDYNIAQIPDFNTLIATSQTMRKPVFALEDADFGHVGVVLEGDRAKREEFKSIFTDLANTVLRLTQP